MAKPVTTIEERFWAKVDKSGECWLWTAAKYKWGYGQFDTRSTGKNIIGAHRFSWVMQNGDIPKGLSVLHKCDTPACVNPKHLFTGTPKDNTDDMMRKGRGGSGPHATHKLTSENHGNAKLTQTQVDKIRNIGETIPRKTLAARFEISQGNLSKILKNEIWK